MNHFMIALQNYNKNKIWTNFSQILHLILKNIKLYCESSAMSHITKFDVLAISAKIMKISKLCNHKLLLKI